MKGLAILIAVLLATACSEAQTESSHYPGPWRSDAPFRLTKTLVANQVRGCGEFYYRTRDGDMSDYAEFLLYCTRDGKDWTMWLAWPARNRVLGPGAIFPDLPPPR